MSFLQPSLYTASDDRSMLKHLVFMGKFDDVAPSENIKDYLLSLVNDKELGYDPGRLREAMAGLKFSINIADLAAPITTYCANMFERPDAVGYGELRTENPKHNICLLRNRIRPSALNISMEKRLKVDAALENNVKRFITRVKEDARACQAFRQ